MSFVGSFVAIVESDRGSCGWVLFVLEPRYCRDCRWVAGDSPFFQDYIPPLQGSSVFASLPRALPWAGMFRPFRAAKSGADIPVCARIRGQTGMSAPH